jgi:hypothetical protein
MDFLVTFERLVFYQGNNNMKKLKEFRKLKSGEDSAGSSNVRPAGPILPVLFVAASFPVCMGQVNAETSFERLSSLLAGTPQGGWVKASTNLFSDAWATGADAAPGPTSAVVRAWSSFAWDSTRGDLLLWGGGHGNYVGNEMYVWDGATGSWGRGSLASRIDSKGFIVDNAAPQSAHTYDNNVYLPANDMFLTFGGAAAPGGGAFLQTDGTNVSVAGPFMWDPRKADPNKVGGTTGSGWNTTHIAQGGNMWLDRHVSTATHIDGTTAYRMENGKDVVYVTADMAASGFPSLYRYTAGDVRSGGQDTWERVGRSWNTVGYQGSGTIDTDHNLYIRTASPRPSYASDLTIWDLDNANPDHNWDIGINLVKADGSDFVMTPYFGIDYDSANNSIVLWDGRDGGGTVWSANVLTDADGNIGSHTTWVVHEIESATGDHPLGNHETGVLGKWKYDPALGAFIALDEATKTADGKWDAAVWLYKPVAGPVPEPQAYALLLAGLGLIGWAVRGRRAG